jgi:hypothetical protein
MAGQKGKEETYDGLSTTFFPIEVKPELEDGSSWGAGEEEI